MGSSPGLYFVIARDDRARFVRPDPENGLHTVGVVDLATVRRNDAGLRDPPAPEDDRFVPLLARRISEDYAVDLFTDLVLVAPPPTLQELKDLLDTPATENLVGTLARDLMVVPDLELWPHLLPWIQPSEADCAPPVPSPQR